MIVEILCCGCRRLIHADTAWPIKSMLQKGVGFSRNGVQGNSSRSFFPQSRELFHDNIFLTRPGQQYLLHGPYYEYHNNICAPPTFTRHPVHIIMIEKLFFFRWPLHVLSNCLINYIRRTPPGGTCIVVVRMRI